MSTDIVKAKVGNTDLIAINDFVEIQAVRGDGGFFPKVTDEQLEQFAALYPNYLDGNVIKAWTYYVYIIKDAGKTIMVDSGVGNSKITGVNGTPQWKGQLLNKMKQAGVSLEEIDLVFQTHIHADHIGWNAIKEKGIIRKTFPKAQYIASKDDYDAFISGATAGAIPAETFEANIAALVDSGDMKLVDASDFELSEHVAVYHTPGHIPGMMYAAVRDGDEVCILSSDNFVSPLQVTDPDCEFLYDVDVAAAKERKKEILEKYTGCKVLLGACHFGLGKIEMKEGTRIWKQL